MRAHMILYDIAIGTITGVIAGIIVEVLLVSRMLRHSPLGKLLAPPPPSSAPAATTTASGWPLSRWA